MIYGTVYLFDVLFNSSNNRSNMYAEKIEKRRE